jgi:hypothetical protein
MVYSRLRVLNLHWLEDAMDTIEDLANAPSGERTYLFVQVSSVDGEDLRDVDDTRSRESAFARTETHISGQIRQSKVRRQRADDYRSDAALVEDIVLNNDVGVAIAGL